jgi:hypothetical protein
MVSRFVFFVLAEIALGAWGIFSFISVVNNNQQAFGDMVKEANSPEYKTKVSLDLPYFDSNVLMLIRFFDLGGNSTASIWVMNNFMSLAWSVAIPLFFIDVARLARPNVWYFHAFLLPLIGQFYGISISHPFSLAYFIWIANRKANESHKNFKGTKPSMILALYLTTLLYLLIQTAFINTSKGPAWRELAYYFLWWPMLSPLLIVGLPLLCKLFGEKFKFGKFSKISLAIFFGVVAGVAINTFLQSSIGVYRSYESLGAGAFAKIASDMVANFAERFLFFDYVIFTLAMLFYVWERSGLYVVLAVTLFSLLLSPGFAIAIYALVREFTRAPRPVGNQPKSVNNELIEYD